ncbi:TonB-dependent receptor [Acetobacter nitrogenifigens]|uniref:TonB-dependent receptor n=2 Tax=Acetobacter nitrogenifigens TaxID=285268 RepID=A0A511XDQ4_9PROT|nr:TonB-dependent receptor [Acetobacter nitrogenifigens]GEN61076.1 TonB-dependent receptor [Acetobacter nitrogenifigens DSM 23921 = NBRC 105050]
MSLRARRTTLMTLLAGSILASVADPADAAVRHGAHHRTTPTKASPAKTAAPAVVAKPAVAAAATAPVSRPYVSSQTEDVAVSGRSVRTRQPGGGLMRAETAAKAVQSVTRDFIAKQPPSSNVQQLIAMMPSVNVSMQDPFGLYSGQVNVRGFDQAEVGWVLDGAPLNDIGGGQFYANEVLESEDLESVQLTPGSVDVNSPVVNASAGLTTMTMSNPTVKAGGLLDISFGSFDTTRQFLRLNSGYIGNSGIRAMFAFSHTKGNQWRGAGQAEKFHYDFKAVKDFENGSHTGLTVSYNDQVNDSYLFPTLSQWRANGYSNNYTADYAGASAAGANYYKLHVNPFRNVVASAPTHIVISPKLSIDDSIYFWHGIGNGTGATYFTSSALSKLYMGNEKVSLNGDTSKGYLALAPSNQEQFRTGNTLSATYKIDKHNTLSLGWWYEYANLEQYSPYGQVNQATGEPYNIWGTNAVVTTTTGQNFRARDFLSLSQVNMIFIGDTMKYFNDRLNITLGFKEAMVTRRTYNYTPGTTYNRNIHSAEPLPQIGISWNFNKQHQIYISGSTNFRVPANTSLVDYYGTAGAQTQRGGSSNPEYTIEEELGYRYNGDVINASVSFFNYNLSNRQQSLNYYVGTTPYSQTVNAGGQTTRGVDAQIGTRPIWYHIRPYATFEYLHSTIDNNIMASTTSGTTDYLPTKGKIAIRSPKVQAGLGLDYDDGHLWISGQLKYIAKQYSTFMNDQSIPQYITNQVAVGYRFKSFGYLKSPEIQLNMQNLTGAKFRNGVYGFQTNANATKGVYGGTIAGSSPTYYLQVPFSAMVTLSTGF